MAKEILDILIELSKRKGNVTTSALAKKLDSSQQTISRKIRYLETHGLIGRTSQHRGQIITITDKGISFMRKKYIELRNIIERSGEDAISFGGNLVSGSGEGSYYVGQDKYFMQFHEKNGFRPHLGTLNIRMKSVHDIKAKIEMQKRKPILIKGFERNKRTFGNILSFACVINKKIKGAVIIPERTHHPSDIVEIISPVNLRKELSLKDNDYVHIEVRS
ncbi:MAG: CTP-dependent riboflavin kinase [Candidatus Aenigmarchaeota archaeon]|nr:CTP-dependent riboflavin kinase [Candidatus Aenigmarchaeota archaeon]